MGVISVSCGGGGGGPDDSGDEFAEVVPSRDGIEVGIVPDNGSALTLDQGLEGEASRIGEHVEAVVARINRARDVVYDILERVMDSDGVAVTLGQVTCRRWDMEGSVAIWRVNVCRVVGGNQYSYVLRGRPLDSAGDGAFRNVMGGVGEAFARVSGEKRGAGVIGFDFNNLHDLTGEGPTGYVAIGYRNVNRYRHLIAGTLDFTAADGTVEADALYDFKRVAGLGGWLQFLFHGDLLADDGAGGVIEGQDGVPEVGRASLAWLVSGQARMGGVMCGGSLGDGNCQYTRQCYAGDVVAFEDNHENEGMLADWEVTACPDHNSLLDPSGTAPDETAVTPPENTEDPMMPGPAVPAPPSDPELEEL